MNVAFDYPLASNIKRILSWQNTSWQMKCWALQSNRFIKSKVLDINVKGVVENQTQKSKWWVPTGDSDRYLQEFLKSTLLHLYFVV